MLRLKVNVHVEFQATVWNPWKKTEQGETQNAKTLDNNKGEPHETI